MKKIASLITLTIFAFSACSPEQENLENEDTSELEIDINEMNSNEEDTSENEDDQIGFDLGSPDSNPVPLVDGTVSDVKTTEYSREESPLTFDYPSNWKIVEDYLNQGDSFKIHDIKLTRDQNQNVAVISFPPREGETMTFGTIPVEEFSYENDEFTFNIMLSQSDPDFLAEVSPDLELEVDSNSYIVNVDILPKSGEWAETATIQISDEIDGDSGDVLSDYKKDLEFFVLHVISSIQVK